MIKGYRDFYYNVKDMDKAIHFYQSAFGLIKTSGNEHWANMTIGNLSFGLHWTEGAEVPLTSRNSHGQNCGGTLTLHSDNIFADRKKLKTRVVKFLAKLINPGVTCWYLKIWMAMS